MADSAFDDRPDGDGASANRRAAVAIALRLIEAGHVAYLAGGCVRDRLLGDEPHDHDIATDATPQRVREVFPKAIGVGEAFGVILVRHAGRTIEVATFRSDGNYRDGRRPDEICFGGPREDALRRDFTINGLFEDPRDGEIIDFVGGRTDLADGVIRAIGDPTARLVEDRLRTLRAVRFAARFGFRIEPATEAAIAVAASELRGVSRERIGHEMRRMLAHPSRAVAVGHIERLGLDVPILEEAANPGARPRITALSEHEAAETALIAWLLDRAAAPSEGDRIGVAARWRQWASRLVLSNCERAAGESVLKAVEHLGAWSTLTMSSRKRAAAAAGFDPALRILAAVMPEVADQRAREIDELATTGLAPTPLLTGDDLIAELGLAPGPMFGPLLERIYDAQLATEVTTRAEAIALARRIAQSWPS